MLRRQLPLAKGAFGVSASQLLPFVKGAFGASASQSLPLAKGAFRADVTRTHKGEKARNKYIETKMI